MTTASPMTSQPEVAAAVVAAGVYEATAHGDDGLELVVVRVHGGPWLVYLDPESTCGWVAYRAEATEDGWSTIPGTGGILGAGDLAPRQIISGLLQVREVPTDPGSPSRSPARHARRRGA
jgi:hypothetical protein